jgi:hypothetical protein
MNKTFKLERNGKQQFVVLRQIAGVDEIYAIGSKVKHGAGARWTVIEVIS